MKKINILVLALCGSLALCSCFGNKENMKLAVGSPDLDYRIDRAEYGLLGPVKSLEIKKDGIKKEFDAGGALIGSDNSLTKFLDRMRFDVSPNGNVVYTYDSIGRVLNVSGPGYSYNYEYGGNYFFPLSMNGEENEESVAHKYSYKQTWFDKYGNWTRRKVNGKMQKRKITYYE